VGAAAVGAQGASFDEGIHLHPLAAQEGISNQLQGSEINITAAAAYQTCEVGV
jgi:hypothetical protein